VKPTVVLRSVAKSFGAKVVVADVSFSARRGECFALMGPNGAGKSTTLKMIHGFIRPSAGTILVNGVDVAASPREARAALGIAPQEDLLDSDLSVARNLYFHGRYHGLARADARRRCALLLGETGLEGHADEPVAHLSTGLRRRLVLARALLTGPAIVILDEPTRGLDRESRRQCLATLSSLKERGATLILATHDLAEAEALCDRAAVLEGGRIRAEGSLWEILREHRAGAGEALAFGGSAC
jgi:lipooligosaccharide transport system ATP-binding protein